MSVLPSESERSQGIITQHRHRGPQEDQALGKYGPTVWILLRCTAQTQTCSLKMWLKMSSFSDQQWTIVEFFPAPSPHKRQRN